MNFELKTLQEWVVNSEAEAELYVYVALAEQALPTEDKYLQNLRWSKSEEATLHRGIPELCPSVAVLFLTGSESSRELSCKARSLLKLIRTAKLATVNTYLSPALSKGIVERLLLVLAELGDEAKTAYITAAFPHRIQPEQTKPEGTDIEACLVFAEQLNAASFDLIKARAAILRQTRCLVNLPANVMTPRYLAQTAQANSLQYGFKATVLGEKEIEAKGLRAFRAVSLGSDEEPCFIVLEYKNAPNKEEIQLALVGKGVTYDSGGYAIKPGEGMKTMYDDMGGSAAVIGAISLLALEKAAVNVTVIVAACENLINGHAYKNGDILTSYSGKTIEVVNTDAEGRLTLADAVSYAVKDVKASHIIDIATLTGAVVAALGFSYTGVLADDEHLFTCLTAAAQVSGDKIWRLPIDADIAKLNDSKRADIKNSGGRYAGAMSAGMFVRAFAEETPWLHLDIAGTAYVEEGSDFAPAEASGVGAELLAECTKQLFA